MSVLVSTNQHRSTCFGCGYSVTHLSPFYGPFHQHVQHCVWVETDGPELYDMYVFHLGFDEMSGYDTTGQVVGSVQDRAELKGWY